MAKAYRRVVVGKTGAAVSSAAVDTAEPSASDWDRGKTREGGERSESLLQPIVESAAAPVTPADAAKQSPNPLLRVFGNLFGALALPARQSIGSRNRRVD